MISFLAYAMLACLAAQSPLRMSVVDVVQRSDEKFVTISVAITNNGRRERLLSRMSWLDGRDCVARSPVQNRQPWITRVRMTVICSGIQQRSLKDGDGWGLNEDVRLVRGATEKVIVRVPVRSSSVGERLGIVLLDTTDGISFAVTSTVVAPRTR